MAKFITFNGITYVHPGAVSKVDVSGLAQVSLSATGIVALVGEAEGGQPNMVTDATDPNFGTPKVFTFFDPAHAKDTFRNGPLADAINLAFDAANDPRIAGGASQVIAIKTNQSTASTATLDSHYTAPNDSCTARSKDYGAHTVNIQVELDVSAADSQNNEVTVTVKDNSTGVTETHNNVAGKSLIDVQYRGPDAGNVIFTGTTTASSGNDKLDDSGTTFTPGGSASAAIGNWIRITSVPSAVVADRELVGQVRRVSGVAGNILTVIEPWITDATPGAARVLPIGTGYEVVREVIGPFLAVDDVTGNSTLSTTAVDDDTVTFHASNKAGTVGLYSVDNSTTSSSSFNSTGVFMLGVATGATDADKYADKDEGPNYIKIVSGPGAGQIRPILSATGTNAVGASQTMVIQIEALDGKGWSPAPTAASRFSFVNLSKGNATTSANGALMIVTGSTGAATQLLCQLKPGMGEWNGASTVSPAGANNNETDITLTISATDTAADIINQLNSPASPAVSLSKQGWFARMGSGRVSTELASQLDWDGNVNTNVFACIGFDQIYSNTWGITSTSAPVTAVKKARLMDNLKQLIDTVNAQSSLISITKLTSAATDGQGMPELNIPAVALTGGAAGTTSTTDLTNAYDVLIRHRHNTVVPLWSADDNISLAEVHTATLSHTNLGSGAAKNENDAILSIDLNNSANPLNDLLNAQAGLNNRNCALVYEGVQRTNVDGELTEFEPHMLGVILAGMQAGSPVGEPLTYKYLRSNDLLFPPELDPKDVTVSNQMLLSGILFAESVKGKGFRIVRNLSTFTQTDNLAFTDRNVNEVLNYVSYDLRTFIEDRFTGVKATPATATAIKDSVISKMSSYRDAEIIVDSTDTVTGQRLNAYRNVRVSISGDIATIRFEMFPVIGINYEQIEIFAQLPTISA